MTNKRLNTLVLAFLHRDWLMAIDPIYGNMNNVMEVSTTDFEKQIHRPTKTIWVSRDSCGLKQLNPAASKAVARYHKLLRCSTTNDANEYNLKISTSEYPSPFVKTLSRSKSDKSLNTFCHEESSTCASGLLAADTSHFGGDLVTQEYTNREQVSEYFLNIYIHQISYFRYSNIQIFIFKILFRYFTLF